ncbi:MAG TPA: C25 family cysteine peptidase, partial [Flavisolibacter sp.]
MRNILLLSALLLFCFTAVGQRTYTASSVLAAGAWKISVSAPGVYKVDVPFLNSLGITGNIPSAQLRFFGNGGGMLPEANSLPYTDDLRENAILVVDGGDGVLNGSDYFLFFAQGPHHWYKDSLNRSFYHRRNLYSDRSYYFIQVGGSGRRIATQPFSPAAFATATSFQERYFHELDTVNFLSSGKEWFGEELSATPGRSLNASFTLPLADLLPGQNASIVTNVAARSVNVPSRFAVSVQGQPVQQLNVLPVGTGQYDLFARQAQQADQFALPANTSAVSFTYTPGSFNSQGWINWFEFFARRSLNLPPDRQLLFRDWNTLGQGAVEYLISNTPAGSQVWDVTEPLAPVQMALSPAGSGVRFSNDAQRLREYVCFSGNFLQPRAEGRVNPQNLHGSTETDYIIITWPGFAAEAEKLAAFHRQRHGLRVLVATTEQIFNEFGSG